jgi:hypothetical protein
MNPHRVCGRFDGPRWWLTYARKDDGNRDGDQYRQANDGGNVQHGYSLSLLCAVRETLLHMGA